MENSLHRNVLIVEYMEERTLIRCCCQQNNRLRHRIDRRKFHGVVELVKGCTSQHRKCLQPAHSGVRIKVYLELSVRVSRREVSKAHYLSAKSPVCNGIQHGSLRDKLRVHILVSEGLPEIEFPLIR